VIVAKACIERTTAIINAFGGLGEQFRPRSRLTYFLKTKGLCKKVQGWKESLDVGRREGFEMPLREFGLWIKRVEMACPTVHKER
jgi:hypothetical protein